MKTKTRRITSFVLSAALLVNTCLDGFAVSAFASTADGIAAEPPKASVTRPSTTDYIHRHLSEDIAEDVSGLEGADVDELSYFVNEDGDKVFIKPSAEESTDEAKDPSSEASTTEKATESATTESATETTEATQEATTECTTTEETSVDIDIQESSEATTTTEAPDASTEIYTEEVSAEPLTEESEVLYFAAPSVKMFTTEKKESADTQTAATDIKTKPADTEYVDSKDYEKAEVIKTDDTGIGSTYHYITMHYTLVEKSMIYEGMTVADMFKVTPEAFIADYISPVQVYLSEDQEYYVALADFGRLNGSDYFWRCIGNWKNERYR